MRLDKGSPAGANKNNEGTGIPTDKFVNQPHQDREMTEKYTEGEQEIADSVRTNHPNRNTDKEDTEGH